MTRDEHMDWAKARAKARALEYAERGDLAGAYSSMASDLQKHPDTANHPGIDLGFLQLVAGLIKTPAQMRNFIEGFN